MWLLNTKLNLAQYIRTSKRSVLNAFFCLTIKKCGNFIRVVVNVICAVKNNWLSSIIHIFHQLFMLFKNSADRKWENMVSKCRFISEVSSSNIPRAFAGNNPLCRRVLVQTSRLSSDCNSI